MIFASCIATSANDLRLHRPSVDSDKSGTEVEEQNVHGAVVKAISGVEAAREEPESLRVSCHRGLAGEADRLPTKGDSPRLPGRSPRYVTTSGQRSALLSFGQCQDTPDPMFM